MKILLTLALIIWARTRKDVSDPEPSIHSRPEDRGSLDYEFDGYNEIGAMG